MKSIFESIFETFSELTIRKFISLICMLILCLLGFVGYERFTSSFSLNRIQKSVELLSELTELRSHNLDPESKAICDRLLAQLQKAVESDPISLRVVSRPIIVKTEIFWKFLFGGAVWFAFSLLNLRKAFRRDGKDKHLSLGLFLGGCFFGVIGVFIPAYCWPYFHLMIYPSIIGVIIIICSLFAAVTAKRKTDSPTPPINRPS